MTAPEQVQVTQADRDCLAFIVEDMGLLSSLTAEHIRRGGYDNDCLPIARHRHTATADALEAMREARFEAGQPATFIGAGGDWNLRCVIVENVEGWWKVRFSDHTEINPSEAIVRPSSLTAAIATLEGDTK
jgi:hypothetical protein